MKSQILKVVTGVIGTGSIEAVDAVTSIDPTVINESLGLIGQIVIIIATIISLFKRKKD